MARTPSDDASRNRIGIDLDSALFVEAGAGTGKTTCLVTRLINLVTHPNPALRVGIDEIAAITFTEKAAAELKERIRRKLDSLLKGEDAQVRLAQDAIDGLEGAAIETIHAFAARILRMTALEMGLPPAFEVRDAIQSDVGFDEWWEQTLEDLLLAPENDGLWDDFFHAGLKLNHAKQFAQKLQLNGHRLGAKIPFFEPDYNGFAERLRALTCKECRNPADLLFQRIQTLTPNIAMLENAATSQERHSALAAIAFPNTNAGKQANWPEELSSVKEEVKSLENLREEVLRDLAAKMVVPILIRIQETVKKYQEERFDKGELEFQDLLVFASDALDKPAALERVRELYKRILVDEFQDTDPLQLEIVEKIAGGEPHRLFFVGDPRQSIYRFRGADLDVYMGKRQALGGSGFIPLTDNFRSSEPIIKWVNETFKGAFGEALEELADLEWGNEKTGSPVRLLGAPLDCKADDARTTEAQTLAAALHELRAEGRDLSDVAILFPSRAILYFIEREFEKQGIPYRVESKSLLFETQEARDLFAVLRAVEDPSDSIAIVSALRTPAFCCSDQDIYDHSALGLKFNYLSNDAAQGESPVARALACLSELHEIRLNGPVGSLAARIVEEQMLLEAGLAQARPRDTWQRYTVLLDQIRAFDESTHGTPRQFLSWAEIQTERQFSLSERIVSERDDKSVRLMTIHAAKGLEFPIVFVAGLGGGEYFESGLRVTWDAQGNLCFKAKNGDHSVANCGALDAFALEQTARNQERERVLYVACTRAKELLVVSQFRPAGHPKEMIENGEQFTCLAQRIGQRLSPDATHYEHWDPTAKAGDFESEPWPAPPCASLSEWVTQREELFSKGRQVNIAATAVAHVSLGESEEPDFESRGTSLSEARPRGRGTNFGLAVHSTLQILNHGGDTRLAKVARAQAAAEGVGPDGVIRAVEAALASEPVQVAFTKGALKEVFASAKVEGVLLEGIIDLLYEDADGLHVVDYKTNSDASPSGRAKAMEAYRLQGGAYALMLEATTGRQVADCKFLFVMGGAEAVEAMDGAELESAKEEVRRRLRAKKDEPFNDWARLEV